MRNTTSNNMKELGILVQQYRDKPVRLIDAHADKALKRLVKSRDAAKAFAAFDAKPNDLRKILDTCLDAECLNRTFHSETERMKEKLAKLDRLDRAIADLDSSLRSER